MTGRAEWGLIRKPGIGIVGVHSLSARKPFKRQYFMSVMRRSPSAGELSGLGVRLHAGRSWRHRAAIGITTPISVSVSVQVSARTSIATQIPTPAAIPAQRKHRPLHIHLIHRHGKSSFPAASLLNACLSSRSTPRDGNPD